MGQKQEHHGLTWETPKDLHGPAVENMLLEGWSGHALGHLWPKMLSGGQRGILSDLSVERRGAAHDGI